MHTIKFLNNFIRPIDGTLTGTTTPDMKGYSIFPKASRMKLCDDMVSCCIRTHCNIIAEGFRFLYLAFRFCGDLRKSRELSFCLRTRELSSSVWTGRLTFGARQGQTSSLQMGYGTWFWADVKAVSIERLCVSLSSCRITFNSKIIKFRTWTNFVNVVYFGFLMSISHICILWVCYNTLEDVLFVLKRQSTFFTALTDWIL